MGNIALHFDCSQYLTLTRLPKEIGGLPVPTGSGQSLGPCTMRQGGLGVVMGAVNWLWRIKMSYGGSLPAVSL